MPDSTVTVPNTPPTEPDAPSLELPAAEAAAPSGALALEPERPESAVEAKAAEINLDPAQARKLEQMVAAYVDAVTALDPHQQAQALTARASEISNLGAEDIRASARVSNRLLQKPLTAVAQGGEQNSKVSRSLLELRRTVERLDPQRHNNLRRRRLLGVIPIGDPMRDYFRKYQSSQTHINDIIVSLYDGQEELRRDNVSIDEEKANLWSSIGRLRQYAYMAQELDATLSARIAEIETTDPERARVLKNDLLFPVRQKREDLLTQLAVSVQGYLALDLIRRNNVELVRGVDRATTTTVSALRTAVIVAQALANQKLVLDQITALNDTTGTLIEQTSEMLKDQTGQVSRQAYEATVGIDRLQKAFANVYATMDEIDEFKVKALDTMAATIGALEAEVEKSRTYIDRTRAQEQARVEAGAGAPGRGSAGELPG
jgi:uncharacterized protein YaaN involved in tellurite resistance